MNILTFDIEDWFHVLDNDLTKTSSEWKNMEVRIHDNMELIFSILEKNNQKATFFCLGWIAEKYPEIIREIDNRGYEIGSHTRMHQLSYSQTPKEFKLDVSHSINSLEDLTGKKVRSFRSPGFSITENNKWTFEILHELGIEIDCSIFPANRAHGGFPTYGTSEPSILKFNGCTLKEFPINTYKLLGKDVVFSGGGYFRIFPLSVIKYLNSKSPYVMSYLHPRDFDKNQPMIPGLSKFRQFKSYVGLSGAQKKLEAWLNAYDFIDINEADRKIEWGNVKSIEI